MLKKMVAVAAVLGVCGLAQAQSFTENFDAQTLPVGPIPTGWTTINVSPGGPGLNPDWQVRTDGLVFAAQGGTGGYAFANFNASTGSNPIDNWLISPQVTWNNGDTITFWTRTVTRGPSGTLDFPDALQVRLAPTNGITSGTQAELVAAYSVLALDINPNLSNNPAPGAPTGNPPTVNGYPDEWTQYTITVSGLPGPSTGRFAFRYFVATSAGPLGINSNYLGVDTVVYTSNAGPACYANCDGSTGTPQLTPADFVCFLNKFRAGDAYANCDGSTGTPALTPADFVCFLNKFRAGC